MEGANLGASRAPAETTCVEPAVEDEHSRDGAGDEKEADPVTPDQCMK
jgi:hypothetical protein